MLRCVLFPGAHLFVTTGGKEQAAGIAREKAEELCKLNSLVLKNEIDWTRGAQKHLKIWLNTYLKMVVNLILWLHNKSSRGKRATGLVEECILVDQTLLTKLLFPTMNVRPSLQMVRHEEEVINKIKSMLTTAGWKNSFAYEKLIQTLIQQITDPGQAIVLGGTWRVPVMEKNYCVKKSLLKNLN